MECNTCPANAVWADKSKCNEDDCQHHVRVVERLTDEVARLKEIEAVAKSVIAAWQIHCDRNPNFGGGFEDHQSLYELGAITNKPKAG